MKTFIRVLRWISLALILYFVIYVSFGSDAPLWFEHRPHGLVFLKIITFSAVVGIYILIYSSIKKKQKIWKNILCFVASISFSLIPILVIAILNTYTCPFWNNLQTPFVKKKTELRTIVEATPKCENNKTLKVSYESFIDSFLFYGEEIK